MIGASDNSLSTSSFICIDPVTGTERTLNNCWAFGHTVSNECKFEVKNKEDISPELMLGDVDGDKDISVMDATLIQLAISRQVTLTDVQINAADTDQDGDMNIMDATAIQLYVAKIITEF